MPCAFGKTDFTLNRSGILHLKRSPLNAQPCGYVKHEGLACVGASMCEKGKDFFLKRAERKKRVFRDVPWYFVTISVVKIQWPVSFVNMCFARKIKVLCVPTQ